MRLFALETDVRKVKERFLAHGEKEIFSVTPHVMSFLIRISWDVLVTVFLGLVAYYSYTIGFFSGEGAIILFLVCWFALVFFALIEAYIDWKFDLLLLTTDKLILLDQLSLFRKSITPITLENLGDVAAQTQWLNLFGFGIIRIALKEGHGPEIVLRYIPDADKLVAQIAQQMTLYQRRKDYVVPYRPRNEDDR
jgi:hypothetical protein